MSTVRDAVLPVLAAYAFFLALLVLHARDRGRSRADPQADPPVASPPPWPALLRYLAVLVTMGYLVFLVIVFVFYPLLGATTPSALLTQAVGYGAVLAFGIALPSFLLLSLVDRRRRARHR
jgi:hypothetical protein